MSDRCRQCNSSRLEPATLVGGAIQPDRAGALKKAFSAAEVKCRVCVECGLVDQLRADPERLRKMLGEG